MIGLIRRGLISLGKTEERKPGRFRQSRGENLANTPVKAVLVVKMDTASPDLQNPSVLAGSHKSVPNVRMMCQCWTEAPNVQFIVLPLFECMS